VSKNIKPPYRDEKELISDLKRGKESAYRSLVHQFQERLIHIAYGITLDREDSMDIVQEVFLKVYTSIHTFKEDSLLYAWLRRITINQSLNWKRRWKRRFRWHHQSLEKKEIYDSVNQQAESNHPEISYISKEQKKILEKGLNSLPENDRTALMLKELEGLSYDEIARMLDIKKGTVSSRIFYARKKLKKNLSNLLEREESR
jgi:RNA polymerase sigma-70 factor (ECF subfamily)